MERIERIDTSDIIGEYVAYHQTHFADNPSKLDIRAVHHAQHTEFFLGKFSAAQALLVLKLLRKIAVDRRVTLLLIVPKTSQTEDLAEAGFVETLHGWCSAC